MQASESLAKELFVAAYGALAGKSGTPGDEMTLQRMAMQAFKAAEAFEAIAQRQSTS